VRPGTRIKKEDARSGISHITLVDTCPRSPEIASPSALDIHETSFARSRREETRSLNIAGTWQNASRIVFQQAVNTSRQLASFLQHGQSLAGEDLRMAGSFSREMSPYSVCTSSLVGVLLERLRCSEQSVPLRKTRYRCIASIATGLINSSILEGGREPWPER
jgi:hypothetical protein